MSNLYITEPHCTGKVALDTTVGEIEIELWGKEAPKATRNFIALCMEGYYDNCIFHRVVPGFIVQTGDPTGTGMGGESFYGEPFETEPHQRLRFNRRGLVGMAHTLNPDEGGAKRGTNTSQFFITMDATPELTGSNTLFGRIAGDTVFNALKVGQFETDADERPLYPPKIRSVRILINPFEDIVPRITPAERAAQAAARAARAKEREQEIAKLERKKLKKNVGLLSFGEEAEAEDAAPLTLKAKVKSSHDLLDDPSLSRTPERDIGGVVPGVPQGLPREAKSRRATAEEEGKGKEKEKTDLRKLREEREKAMPGSAAARRAEIERAQAAIRKLDRRRRRGSGSSASSDSSDEDEAQRKKKLKPAVSYLDEARAAYVPRGAAPAGRKAKREKEDGVLGRLKSFQARLGGVAVAPESEDEGKGKGKEEEGKEREEGGEESEGDDEGWMSHMLKSNQAAELEAEQVRRAEAEYDVVDPRAKARALQRGNKDRDRVGPVAGASLITPHARVSTGRRDGGSNRRDRGADVPGTDRWERKLGYGGGERGGGRR